VSALALIDTAPDLDAVMDQGLLGRLLLAPLPGRLLWCLRTEITIRKALASAFTRSIDIPGTIIEATMGMTHRALAATSRASDDYLKQQTLPGRLAALGLPVLVIVGADDKRWRSTSAAAYRAVPGARLELLPGVGHTPMMEDPQTTSTLPLDFAAAARHPPSPRHFRVTVQKHARRTALPCPCRRGRFHPKRHFRVTPRQPGLHSVQVTDPHPQDGTHGCSEPLPVQERRRQRYEQAAGDTAECPAIGRGRA
jgi:hypothetical protein